MEKKKLITALMVGCMAFLPANADSTIDSNITGGTGIHNSAGETMTVNKGVTISGNNGDYSGGIWNEGNLIIQEGTKDSHVTFSGNKNSSPWGGGGAIYSYASGTNITIGHYTSFENNNKDVNVPAAGAVYVGNATQLTIGDYVNFSGNSAGQGNSPGIGGAMYIENSTTTIGQAINVESNTAASGGGLFISNPNGSTATIRAGAVFTKNEALTGDGGALVSDMTNLTIDSGARFKDNIAAGNGGAISTAQTFGTEQAGKVTIGDGAQFINNVAKNGNGGAIYNTTNVEIQGGKFTGNSAKLGGAIYNSTGGSMSLANVTFNAADSNGSNSIYNAGSVTTASTDNNTNLFASTTTIDGDWTYGGNNNVTGNIDGSGKIINEGNTTFAGNNSQFTGSFTQSDSNAETTVTGTFFGGTSTVSNGTLNWETQTGIPSGGKLNITGGNLNIGSTNSPVNLALKSGSSISDAVTTVINSNSTLSILDGGKAEIGANDTWDGEIYLDGGDLSLSGITTGILDAVSGSLTMDNVTLGNNITIGRDIDVTSTGNGDIVIGNGATFTYDDNDNISNKLVLDGGTLNYEVTDETTRTELSAVDGALNLAGNSILTIDGNSVIADAVALDIQKGSTLTLNSAVLNLDNADKWDGKIINEQGTINANGLINDSQTASLKQTGGVLNVYNDAHLTLGKGSEITGGKINITKGADFTLANGTIEGGYMTIDENSAFIVKNGTFSLNSINGKGVVDQDGIMHASLVDVANGQRVQHSIKELAIDTQTNFNMDIHARGNHYTSNDQFVVSSMTGNGTARIDNWSLNGDIFGWDAPIDRHIVLDHIFVDKNGNPLEGNIEITRRTEFTPIGYYQLNQKGSGTGLHYTLDLVDFNPQVFRGQVATVAQWMNQLAIDDMLFTHSMVLPSFKDEDGGKAYSGMMVNRYASSNPLFAPYQYSRKDGGLWYKMYGTFENLNMNVSGLGRVGNNAYGALIGADFGLKELKNGWKFMPTAYVGYNGAHQAYPGIGAYQNGGQAGFLGTWYKNNFILGGLVYGGVYENSMDVAGHVDNAFNYFAGAATKFAYNWRFHRDWVLQPNLMAAYNFFGQQNWHSDYGQMGMMAGMLNGVNIAPGVNLIWEKETFSIYGTLQYMYNVNGAVGGRAGNVGLPQVEMERGYIQYGLGFNKRWGERFSGYLQAVLRNVGRTGVGFQLGFNFLLGK